MRKHCLVPAVRPVASKAVSFADGCDGRSDQPDRICRWISYPVTVMVGLQVGVVPPLGAVVAAAHCRAIVEGPTGVAVVLTGGQLCTLAADADADAAEADADAEAEAADAAADDCRACTTDKFTHWATLNSDW